MPKIINLFVHYMSLHIFVSTNNKTTMKKIIFTLVAGVFATTASFAQTNWTGDNSHSSVLFSVGHMGVAKTVGFFTEYDVRMTSTKDDFTGSQVEITIQAKSINTMSEQRDNHLRSKDFFNTDTFPTITFKSTSFTKKKGNVYEIKGMLTMRGVTKEVVLEAVYGGTKKDPWGNEKSGWAVRGKVDRTAYGITWNTPIEGGTILDNSVEFMCEFEMVKKK